MALRDIFCLKIFILYYRMSNILHETFVTHFLKRIEKHLHLENIHFSKSFKMKSLD